MFSTIFCAVPAFIRVDPAIASCPVSGVIAICAARASGEFGLDVTATVTHPCRLAHSMRAQHVRCGPARRDAHNDVSTGNPGAWPNLARRLTKNPQLLPPRHAAPSLRRQSAPAPFLAASQTSADIPPHPAPPAARSCPRRCRRAATPRKLSQSRPPRARFAAILAAPPAPPAVFPVQHTQNFNRGLRGPARASAGCAVPSWLLSPRPQPPIGLQTAFLQLYR